MSDETVTEPKIPMLLPIMVRLHCAECSAGTGVEVGAAAELPDVILRVLPELVLRRCRCGEAGWKWALAPIPRL